MPDLTVFVATYNRTTTLHWCIHWLEHQRMPKRIVIVDNGSRDDIARQTLDELSRSYAVYRMPAIEDVPILEGDWEAHGGHSMQAVQRNVEEAFRLELLDGNRSRWFGMTDADVWLDGREDSLDCYLSLAEQTGRAVGPHLRLDTHKNYPLRAAAIIQHARILYRRHQWGTLIPWSPDPIDTTFHLFPAGPTFNRLGMSTARVGPPWTATHSDWLIDIQNPSYENFSYINGCGEAASWGGRWLRPFFQKWQKGVDAAYEFASTHEMHYDDYHHIGFMHAWMVQYGHGCASDREYSIHLMDKAVPSWSPCREFRADWEAMVYDNNFDCLGWQSP